MHLRFTDHFVRALPGDVQTGRAIRQVHGAVYSRITPEPVDNPRLLLWSGDTAALLGVPDQAADVEAVRDVLAGNAPGDGANPYASVYGGHQFGHWAGQLGDGRAINLGEIGAYTLQIKGAGRTPFSRHADGRAVLRSSIREFLCSEAMHHLGIPSTRALSLIVSDTLAVRDMFYDGNPQQERCALVCRVSESFLRFGHFELPSARGDIDLLRRLLDYSIARHFPDIDAAAPDAPAYWFDAVCQGTARLIAQWMAVGFVHGVMNTDNMSVLSETIDYGPYGWLEKYDPQWTPNTTDAQGRRYCYGQQPAVAQWNLARLGSALFPLLGRAEPLQASLDAYNRSFHAHWNRLLAAKLGLPEPVLQRNPAFQAQLLNLLATLEMDFSLFFDTLTRIAARGGDWLGQESVNTLLACSYADAPDPQALRDWLATYQALPVQSPLPQRSAMMRAANPVFVLRNHLVQDVIEAAEQGEHAPLQAIFRRLRTPFDDAPDDARWIRRCPPESMQRAGCSMLSCSS